MDASKISSISGVSSDQAIGEFWDSNDFTEFDTDAPDIEFVVACPVPIERELFRAIEEQAERHGVQIETLVNLWLQQKLVEQAS